MVTVTETKQSVLDTPEDIIAFLSAEYTKMSDSVKFKPGDQVSLAKRDGVPSEMAIGDVGIVVLCQEAPNPYTHVLCVHQTGARVVIQIQTANLVKRTEA